MNEPTPLKRRELPPNQFSHSADYDRQTWHALVPADHLFDDMMKPAYWVHHASKLKPMALIDIVTEDGMLDVQFRVLKVELGLVYVRPRLVWEHPDRKAMNARRAKAGEDTAPLPELPPDYKSGYAPNGGGYWVQLKSTGNFIVQKLPSRRAAIEFAIKHATDAGLPLTAASAEEKPAEPAAA